jgi:chromatin remodeling complex protein RSC6
MSSKEKKNTTGTAAAGAGKAKKEKEVPAPAPAPPAPAPAPVPAPAPAQAAAEPAAAEAGPARKLEELEKAVAALSAQLTAVKALVKAAVKEENATRARLQREAKVKRRRRDPAADHKPSGIVVPHKVTDSLLKFMSLPAGSEVSRTQASKAIIDYLKGHKLQNEKSKRFFETDATIQKLLNMKPGEPLTVPLIQRYIGPLFV